MGKITQKFLFRYSEHSVPADAAVFLVQRQPDEYCFSNDVVFRDKAPITRVGGIVAVVAHHPIVIHLKGVGISWLTIDENLVAFNFQVVKLVGVDDALVERQISGVQSHGDAFLWQHDWSVIVDIPRI